MKVLVALLLLVTALLINTANATTSSSFRCAGTVPNWSLDINPKTFTYHTENENVTIAPTKPHHATGLPLGYLRVYHSKIENTDSPITILIENKPEGCTDGTHQTLHEFSAIIVFSHKTFVGCCDKMRAE